MPVSVRRRFWLLLVHTLSVASLVALAARAPATTSAYRVADAARARDALAELPRAIDLFRAGRYDAASELFDRMAADLPGPEHSAAASAFLGLADSREYARILSGLHSNLGVSHLRARRHDEAVAALEKAVEIDPTAAGPRTNLAMALRHQRRYADARDAFEQALARGARSQKLLLDFGDVCLRLGDRPRARWALARARLRASADVAAWGTALEADALLAQLDFEEGQPRAAETGYRAVLARTPGHVRARYGLLRLLLRDGRTREAAAEQRRFERDSALLNAIESVLAGQPGSVAPMQWVADSYRALGLLHLADVHYRQLLSRNPGDTKALLALRDLEARARASAQPATRARQDSQ